MVGFILGDSTNFYAHIMFFENGERYSFKEKPLKIC